jgi:hypothetical protein
VAIPALGAATFFALRGDGTDGYWVGHPMLGSLVSGLLLLVFALFVVNEYLEWREKSSWRQVAHLSCHTLGDIVTRGIVVGLAVLYADRPATVRAPWESRAGWKTDALEPLQEIREIPEGRDSVRVFDSPKLPPPVLDAGGLIPGSRLRCLLHSPEWRLWAIEHLREVRVRGREAVASWAPVMISAEEPRRLLNHVAALNDDLGELRVAIERLQQDDAAGLEDRRESWATEILKRWQLLDARARLLTNELWRTAGQADWGFVLPATLGGVPPKKAFASPDRIGAWEPPVVSADPRPGPEHASGLLPCREDSS